MAERTWVPSRGECPLRYAIADLQVAKLANDGTTKVGAVIAYERIGFEGTDVRFFPIALVVSPLR